MENGQSMNASQAQRSFNEELTIEGEQIHNDILTRRMKNRERQRRYRARKRLEADSMKSSIITQSSPPPMEEQPIAAISNWSDQQPISVVENWTGRVHSRRDWKKDARRAHVGLKDSEVSSSESPSLGSPPASKAELPLERALHPNASLDLVNCPPHGTPSGRRDWKAEARKRKT